MVPCAEKPSFKHTIILLLRGPLPAPQSPYPTPCALLVAPCSSLSGLLPPLLQVALTQIKPFSVHTIYTKFLPRYISNRRESISCWCCIPLPRRCCSAGCVPRKCFQEDLLERAAELGRELRETSEGLEVLKHEVSALRESIRWVRSPSLGLIPSSTIASFRRSPRILQQLL